MKRVWLACFTFILLLSGCTVVDMISMEELERIDVYEVKGLIELQLDSRISFEETAEIETFVESMNNAVLQENEGIGFEPDYQIELNNGEGIFLLSLDEKEGKFVQANHEEKVYVLTEESVAELWELLQ
ncbi:hypothetical protein [Ornithinibacillus scapharcae]|uniref:hypothetical protein n=1 Tax=Ornithinibacillus scapharcae TaxID=1147159 RepID=UPI000225B819|nr:hypothetical protein [Ornithinibacillus scapharcae]